MDSIILDRYAGQPLITRMFWNALTGAGWCFWIYLWSPLLVSGTAVLGITHGSSMVGLRMINALIRTSASHALLIFAFIGGFLLWALIQKVGDDKTRQPQTVDAPVSSHLVSPTEQDLAIGRGAVRLLVFHDDQSGRISHMRPTFRCAATHCDGVWQLPYAVACSPLDIVVSDPGKQESSSIGARVAHRPDNPGLAIKPSIADVAGLKCNGIHRHALKQQTVERILSLTIDSAA